MNLTVAGHHVEVTESLNHYVGEKIQKLERHFDNLTDIHVTLTVEKQRQKAEATAHVSGATLYADDTDENMYAAIDLMTDKLDRQLLKYKEKLRDHHKREKEKIEQRIQGSSTP